MVFVHCCPKGYFISIGFEKQIIGNSSSNVSEFLVVFPLFSVFKFLHGVISVIIIKIKPLFRTSLMNYNIGRTRYSTMIRPLISIQF